jgi:hypothetical protein
MADKFLSLKVFMYDVSLNIVILYITDHNETNFTENATIGIDLSKDWTNTSLTPVYTERPPGLYGRTSQTLWSDEKRNVYCFGGDNPKQDRDAPAPSDSIQGFTPDGNSGGNWTEILVLKVRLVRMVFPVIIQSFPLFMPD